MNEYIFFDTTLRDRFLGFVSARGLDCSVRPDRIEGFVVTLPDELADEVEEAIENEYEALMDDQRMLIESADDTSDRTLMGVAITLPDGRPLNVRIPARYARRLFDQFSVEEIRELVTIIAHGVVNPVDGPLCRKA